MLNFFGNRVIHQFDAEYSLQGLNGTTLFVNSDAVVITGRIIKHRIEFAEINRISLVDDGKTLPHIAITKQATYVKGDSEYDFYYDDDPEKVAEVVAFMKSLSANC